MMDAKYLEEIKARCKKMESKQGMALDAAKWEVKMHSVNDIPELISEVERLTAELKKYQEPEQWLNDVGDPLEPVKIVAALRSEIMKYNLRLKNNPESINELDTTIIYALRKVLE